MIDRDLCRRLLHAMTQDIAGGVWLGEFDGIDQRTLVTQLRYLEQHGLCESGVALDATGPKMIKLSRITAQGLDYIAEDGGIGAELNVVTIRLSADTLKAMLTLRIEQSDVSTEEKRTLKAHLQSLSAKGLEGLVGDLVQAGLAHVPDAIGLLRMYAGL